MPPFGTIRENGYLVPFPYGAWLLPDGSFQRGEVGQEPPVEEALWRGYYDCARRVLEVYTENLKGRETVAYTMVDEGWAFRDRKGNPRPFNKDDVRRITSNWPQYAGLSPQGKAKDFNPNLVDDPVGLIYDTGRQVFSLELLRKVAQVHQKRGGVRRPPGSQKNAHPYALTRLLYCAHCEHHAEEQNNPALRTRISGHDRNGQLRYRHAEGVKCGGKRKSVAIDVIEDDFARLIHLLTVKQEALPLMVDLALQAEGGGIDDEDFEAQKAAAIAKAKRRVENARFLFLEGDISQDEYLRRKEHNERQIAHWEVRTTASEKAAIELAMCMNALDNLAQLFDTADDEDKQQMARMLFEYIVYDLDRQQIVDFRLKPWADRYLVLRAALYGDDDLAGDPVPDDGGSDDSGGSEAGVSGTDSKQKDNGPDLKTRTDYCPIEMRWKVKQEKRRVLGGKSARGTGSAKQLEVDQKQSMKAEGRWKGSGARVTSGQLVGLVLQQQGEDEPYQLTGGQDEGTTMLEAHRFAVLTLIEGLVVRRVKANAIGALDEVVTQIAVAGLGQAARFTVELAGVKARPPQPGESGEGGLTLMNHPRLAIRLGHEAVHILDFGQQPGGIDRANTRDRSEMGITG
jgi:hypothetical protein